MESSTTSLNGSRNAVTVIENRDFNPELVLERQVPVVTPDAPVEKDVLPQPQPEEKDTKPKGKKPIKLILAALGVGAIAASSFGDRWWQYASTHEQTDNATVAGYIHQVSSRINGTISNVLVNDNQLVQKGQLLVKLDPRDYENKVQQVEAAIKKARLQAQSARVSINLASQNAQANTTQTQGEVSSAIAAISTAKAAVNEAQAGIPAAQVEVAQAEANLQQARADYERYNSLFKQGAIPRQQLDTTRAAYQVPQAQS